MGQNPLNLLLVFILKAMLAGDIMTKSIFNVVITNKSSGSIISRIDADDFMAVAKESFGIGRNAFLADYVKRYNEVKQNERAEIKPK